MQQHLFALAIIISYVVVPSYGQYVIVLIGLRLNMESVFGLG
ncbi:hypothetical protein SAMN02745225_00874 [Ferrithrix thermotolerans DSM 19514]|uniref:Uncharacterized protein n=1 Tax=Ferrithrix thermotolerans DSM 19514 TaxID=1121881 RepID=A0A1M4U6P8_9ACTN|nr:hypothetical protein SAMN02745225_00874 [Ferrithrix thermotolerans DSM 19514]